MESTIAVGGLPETKRPVLTRETHILQTATANGANLKINSLILNLVSQSDFCYEEKKLLTLKLHFVFE